MISGLFIIFLFLLLGNLTSNFFGIPVPGSVIGMIYLAVSLHLKIVKLEAVKNSSDILVKNMAFLFVPPGVGVMVYFGLIKQQFAAIVVSFFISAFAVLVSVGVIQQFISEKTKK